MNIIRATKKPVTVEAVRIDGTAATAQAIQTWTDNAAIAVRTLPLENEEYSVSIRTLEGEMIGNPGWVIIRGVQGEFYPCEPSIFEATYDYEEEPGG